MKWCLQKTICIGIQFVPFPKKIYLLFIFALTQFRNSQAQVTNIPTDFKVKHFDCWMIDCISNRLISIWLYWIQMQEIKVIDCVEFILTYTDSISTFFFLSFACVFCCCFLLLFVLDVLFLAHTSLLTKDLFENRVNVFYWPGQNSDLWSLLFWDTKWFVESFFFHKHHFFFKKTLL